MGFTRNYKNMVLSQYYPVGTSGIFDKTSNTALKRTNGTIDTVYWVLPTHFSNYGDHNDDYMRSETMALTELLFGTDDSNESIDDYKITELTGLVYQDKKLNYTQQEDGTYIVHFDYVIYNATDATIHEFGLFNTVRPKRDATSQTYMIYRKKLDTPIELIANTPVGVSFDVVFAPII